MKMKKEICGWVPKTEELVSLEKEPANFGAMDMMKLTTIASMEIPFMQFAAIGRAICGWAHLAEELTFSKKVPKALTIIPIIHRLTVCQTILCLIFSKMQINRFGLGLMAGG